MCNTYLTTFTTQLVIATTRVKTAQTCTISESASLHCAIPQAPWSYCCILLSLKNSKIVAVMIGVLILLQKPTTTTVNALFNRCRHRCASGSLHAPTCAIAGTRVKWGSCCVAQLSCADILVVLQSNLQIVWQFALWAGIVSHEDCLDGGRACGCRTCQGRAAAAGLQCCGSLNQCGGIVAIHVWANGESGIELTCYKAIVVE
jgi:hypothetical protein